jgi:hypothetical protein
MISRSRRRAEVAPPFPRKGGAPRRRETRSREGKARLTEWGNGIEKDRQDGDRISPEFPGEILFILCILSIEEIAAWRPVLLGITAEGGQHRPAIFRSRRFTKGISSSGGIDRLCGGMHFIFDMRAKLRNVWI